jgi:WD40 repeat protein
VQASLHTATWVATLALVGLTTPPLSGVQEQQVAGTPDFRPELVLNQGATEEWDDWVHSEDGRVVAYSSMLSNSTQVRVIATRRTVATLPQRGRLALSKDGSSLAIGSLNGTVSQWGPAGLRSLGEGRGYEVTAIVMTPDAGLIAAGDAGGWVRVWTPAGRWEFEAPSRVEALSLSADGSRVLVCWGLGTLAAGARGGGSAVLDSKTERVLTTLDGPEGYGVISCGLSADGSLAVTVRDATPGVQVWNAKTGRRQNVVGAKQLVGSIALNAVGTRLLAATASGDVTLVDVASGSELARASSLPGEPRRLQFIQNETRVTAALFGFGSLTLSAGLRPSDRFSEIRTVPVPLSSVQASADGLHVLGRAREQTIVWDMARAGRVRFRAGDEQTNDQRIGIPLPGAAPRPCNPRSSALAPDGTLAVVSCRPSVLVFPPDASSTPAEYAGFGWVDELHFSPSGRYLMAAATIRSERKLMVWDLTSGTTREVGLNPRKLVRSAGFISDERLWLLLGQDPFYLFDGPDFLVVDVTTGQIERQHHVDGSCEPNCGIVSPRGGFFIYWSPPSALRLRSESRLWSASTGAEIALPQLSVLGGYAGGPAFTCDERRIAFSVRSPARLALYDTMVATTISVRPFTDVIGFVPRDTPLLQFSCDGSLFILADGRLFRFLADSNDPATEFNVAPGVASAFAEIEAGNRVVVAGSTGLDLFDKPTATKVARLTTFSQGPWFASAADGRFDTDDLDSLAGVSWIVPDDPSRPMPVEIFMRDYFEPRLLPRLLAGESLPPLRPLAALNRVQPRIEIEDVRWMDPQQGLAEVTISVERAAEAHVRNGKPTTVSTGAYDLRLFRDGQLVAWAPAAGIEWQRERPSSANPAEGSDLPRWRELTRIQLDATGSARLAFPVQVPRRSDLKAVRFSAYVFNEDRVKSPTVTRDLRVVSRPRVRRGRAYVISVGVNETESTPAWDLQYAVNDARTLSESVSTRLRAAGNHADVVPLRLISERGLPRPGEGAATKANLQTVLALLSGQVVPPERAAAIPSAERLQKVEPEDLVLISVSSHGYTDSRGVFHFVLADIGNGHQSAVTEALDAATLSSDELSAWIRQVDAGELVLIVDACHSEATVQADGFKPGPMGSRGLGQLAYDKGMRVLAASKATEAAIERGGAVQQGLLTYALVREGLESGRADFQPTDGTIALGEWLAYAVAAVPRLFSEGDARGSVAAGAAPDGTRDGFLGRRRTRPAYQQPVLFDFARSSAADLRIATVRRR